MGKVEVEGGYIRLLSNRGADRQFSAFEVACGHQGVGQHDAAVRIRVQPERRVAGGDGLRVAAL